MIKQLYQSYKRNFGHLGIGKIYPLNKLNEFITNKIRKNKIVIHGNTMYLDKNDVLGLSTNGFYERQETEIVLKNVKSGNVVLDIGANIGYYTLLFAKLVGKKGKVYAFEPDKDNFKILKKNVEVNGYGNVILINKAVSDTTGKEILYLNKENTGDHKTYDSNEYRDCVQIDCIRLDDCVIEKKVDFIKIDIQGAEYKALANSFTLNNTKKIVTEYWQEGLKQAGVEPQEYLNLLKNNGFKLTQIKMPNGKFNIIYGVKE